MSLTWSVGQKISASRLNRRLPVTAEAAGDSAKSSNATLGAHSDLVLSLKADTTYEIGGQLYVLSAANAAGDFQYAWSWTGSATVYMGAEGANNAALASGSSADGEWVFRPADSSTPSTGTPYGASTNDTSIRVNDKIVVGASDLTLTLMWAQNSSNANATTLKGGSWVTATPVD